MCIYKNYAQRLFTYRCLSLNLLINFGAKHITKLPVVFLKRQVKFPFYARKKAIFFHNAIYMLIMARIGEISPMLYAPKISM